MLARYRLDPASTLFVDDMPVNVEAARSVGLTALPFTGADQLEADLRARGVLG
jgi:FMN phosphatase YigB (HAD superfamily)